MKNIVLVGMMSSGKTTIGRILAKKLNYTFIDLDALIETDQNTTISKLFSEKGEHFFREIESKILKSLTINNRLVIASGGGTPCFHNNMEYIKSLGTSVYLDIPASALARRIKSHGKDDRPILSGAESLQTLLQSKIDERAPFYHQADIHIQGELPIDNILTIILEVIQK
jgi:shikimate kinase